ncbi:hypothetical protein ACKI2N_020400 [Cupriavidus sp. 30B13]|uniref:hypothetical protein n=1 Tax=Cupriavidus sp. 30B13 TaxID=3384241 RepID=UPI003B9059D5
MLELISQLVSDAGWRVLAAAPNRMPVFAGLAPKVIIIDLASPLSVAQFTLRGVHALFPRARIVAVSAYFQFGPGTAAETARQLGVERVMAKPFSCAGLTGVVNEMLLATAGP